MREREMMAHIERKFGKSKGVLIKKKPMETYLSGDLDLRTVLRVGPVGENDLIAVEIEERKFLDKFLSANSRDSYWVRDRRYNLFELVNQGVLYRGRREKRGDAEGAWVSRGSEYKNTYVLGEWAEPRFGDRFLASLFGSRTRVLQ